jgi:hypothetical protein
VDFFFLCNLLSLYDTTHKGFKTGFGKKKNYFQGEAEGCMSYPLRRKKRKRVESDYLFTSDKKGERKDPLGNLLPTYIRYDERKEMYIVEFFRLHQKKTFSCKEGMQKVWKKAKLYWRTYVGKERSLRFKRENVVPGQSVSTYRTPVQSYHRFVEAAHRRKKKVELTCEEFIRLTKEACYFCGVKPDANGRHTLDRISSNAKIYNEKNCIVTCLFCNLARGAIDMDPFLAHVRLIFLHQQGPQGYALPPLVWAPNRIHPILQPTRQSLSRWKRESFNRGPHDYLTEESVKARYKRFVYQADHRCGNQLTFLEYWNLIRQPCFYCGVGPDETSIGIDRQNSEKPYERTNVVPACNPCNLFKNSSTVPEVLKQCERILRHQGFLFQRPKTGATLPSEVR